MTAEERAFNEASKVRPTVSTGCMFGVHSECEGSESALWPDGTFSVRPCSCTCHSTTTGREALNPRREK